MSYIDKINIDGVEYDIQDSNLKSDFGKISENTSINLMPIKSLTSVVNGVNVDYENGIITRSGTATVAGGRLIHITPNFTLTAGNYVFWSSTTGATFFIENASTNAIIATAINNAVAQFTLTKDTVIYVGTNLDSGKTYNDSHEVQIELGSVKTEFQPPNMLTAFDKVARERPDGAPAIIETASGAVASFDNGADGMSVQKLIINIEPKQDLHGYNYPWPAGAGKNLLDKSTNEKGKGINENGQIVSLASANYTQLIPVVENDTYTISGISGVSATWSRRLHGYDAEGVWVKQLAVIGNTAIPIGTAYNTSVVIPQGVVNVRYSYATAVNLFEGLINLILLTIANFASKKLTDSALSAAQSKQRSAAPRRSICRIRSSRF